MSFQITKPKVLDLKRKQPIVSRAGASACGLMNPTLHLMEDAKKPKQITVVQSVMFHTALWNAFGPRYPVDLPVDILSKAHNSCSESFYKTEIEQEIVSRPAATIQEKKAMMQILTKFEEEQTFVDDPNGSSDDDDPLSQLEGVDLDTLGVEELWTRLSPAQRAAFEEGIRDPRSSLSAQLLTTIAETPPTAPWWEHPEDFESPTQNEIPLSVSIPQGLLDTMAQPSGGAAGKLLFNITAVCLAYVYCVRSFGVSKFASLPSHDRPACQRLVAELVPFLMDRSTLLLRSVSEARSSVQSRLNDKLSPRLLSDVSLILRPRAVVEVDKQAPLQTQASVANERIGALTFLSDLFNLFEHSSRTPTLTKKTPSHVLHKLNFYAAQVATCPAGALRTLAEDLHHLATYMETTEQGKTETVLEQGIALPFGLAVGDVDRGLDSGSEPPRRRSRPTIEQLN